MKYLKYITFTFIFILCLLRIDVSAESNDDVELLFIDKTEPVQIEENTGLITNKKCIKSENYFRANPKHKENDASDNPLGTCTTVAMQLLLGYHNYYSDRRLIPEIGEDNIILLDEDYGNLEDNPLINSTESFGYGRSSIGTANGVYSELMRFNDLSNVPLFGQIHSIIVSAAYEFIDCYASEIKENVVISTNSYSKEVVMNELNNDRPVILGFNLRSSSLHNVVAYGSAYYDGEFGYVVHYGWGQGKTYVWIPETWCMQYIVMQVNHIHNYQDTNTNILEYYREIDCSICGCKMVDYIYDVNPETKTLCKVNYELNGEIDLPIELYGTRIEYIQMYAFKNMQYITKIILPYTLKNIDSYAFENCCSLEQIIIGSTNIIYCGINIFEGCSNLSTIRVPSDKLITYATLENWNSYSNLITSINPPGNIVVNQAESSQIIKNISSTDHLPKKLIVTNDNHYNFSISSSYEYFFAIYNSQYVKLDVIESKEEYDVDILEYHLDEGEYYLNFYYLDSNNHGSMSINISLTLEHHYSVFYGNNNILFYVHKKNSNSFVSHLNLSINNPGFYKIQLSCILSDGSIYECDDNQITIYDNPDILTPMYKYNTLDSESKGINNLYQNEFIVYLNPLTYYIEINLTTNDFVSLNLEINEVENIDVNLFEYPSSSDEYLYSYMSIYNFDYDNLVKFKFNQSLTLSLNTTGFYTGKFIVLQEELIDGISTLTNLILKETMNNGYGKTISLEQGTYYIGYINATMSADSTCTLKRILSDFGDGFLLPDIADAPIYGTEVTLNNGTYNSNEITQGFTRIINLYNRDSRLDYYWYSSNESVARVTDFGTIMALSVTVDTPVLIMAVNKEDPSKTYVKEFIIKVETNTFEDYPLIYNIDMTITVTNIVNSSQINLSNQNVPINWLQYYLWISPDDNITVNNYGIITVNQNAIGNTYQIVGAYRLNPRVLIYINLQVN